MTNDREEKQSRTQARMFAEEYANEHVKTTHDPVLNPKHYEILEGVESIHVIACSLTRIQWHGFCLGNILKYRIRAGKKGIMEQDISKACYYEELFNEHKHLNRET